MLDSRKFYIDGKWVAPLAANDLDVLNPVRPSGRRRGGRL
jgi:hypothetical protein